MAREYDHTEKLRALEALEQGATYREAAALVGADAHTVFRWKQAAEAGTLAARSDVAQQKKELFAELAYEAKIRTATKYLDNLDEVDISKTGDLRDLAVSSGIWSDKWHDATEGRKGGATIVVNPGGTADLLDKLDLDTLRWLRAMPPEERGKVLQLALERGPQAVIDGKVRLIEDAGADA